MLKRLERTTLSDMVIHELVALMRTGKLKPGDRVPSEQELSASFGVGRTSVREALKALQVLGIIQRHNDGAFVSVTGPLNTLEAVMHSTYITQRLDFRHLFEARRAIEGALWRLAALHADEVALSELTALCEHMEATSDDMYESYFALDMKFHQRICELSGNPVLSQMWAVIRELLEAEQSHIRTLPQIIEQSNVNHRSLVTALASRNPARAEAAIREALDHIEDLFARDLRKDT